MHIQQIMSVSGDSTHTFYFMQR